MPNLSQILGTTPALDSGNIFSNQSSLSDVAGESPFIALLSQFSTIVSENGGEAQMQTSPVGARGQKSKITSQGVPSSESVSEPGAQLSQLLFVNLSPEVVTAEQLEEACKTPEAISSIGQQEQVSQTQSLQPIEDSVVPIPPRDMESPAERNGGSYGATHGMSCQSGIMGSCLVAFRESCKQDSAGYVRQGEVEQTSLLNIEQNADDIIPERDGVHAIKALSSAKQEVVSEVKLSLNAATIGDMTVQSEKGTDEIIKVDLAHGINSIEGIEVNQQEGKLAVESTLSQLIRSLGSQGIQVKEIQVTAVEKAGPIPQVGPEQVVEEGQNTRRETSAYIDSTKAVVTSGEEQGFRGAESVMQIKNQENQKPTVQQNNPAMRDELNQQLLVSRTEINEHTTAAVKEKSSTANAFPNDIPHKFTLEKVQDIDSVPQSFAKRDGSAHGDTHGITAGRSEAVKPAVEIPSEVMNHTTDALMANKKNAVDERAQIKIYNRETHIAQSRIESETKPTQQEESKAMVIEGKETVRDANPAKSRVVGSRFAWQDQAENTMDSFKPEQNLEHETGVSEKSVTENRTVNSSGGINTIVEKSQGTTNSAVKEAHINSSDTLLSAMRHTIEESPTTIKLENPLPRVEPEQIVRNIVKEAAMSLREGKSEMRMHLEPESLGELVLKVSVENGTMSARIEVKHPEVQNVIEANLAKLRDSLAMQGIHVERVDVYVAGEFPSKQYSERNLKKPNTHYRNRAYAVNSKEHPTVKYLGYNTIEYII